MTQPCNYSSLRWSYVGRLRSEEILAEQRRALAKTAAHGQAGPTLLIAEAAEPVLLFGRFRRIPEPFLEDDAAKGWAIGRRMTGGRPVPCVAGDLHISLILDASRELVGGRPVPLPPEKILNRCVRGILGALRALGMKAFYPGRDFITVGGKRLALVSFDVPGPAGAVLFEAVIAREESFDEGERTLSGLGVPLRHGPGCPADLSSVSAEAGRAVSAEELARSIVHGYEDAMRLVPQEVGLSDAQRDPIQRSAPSQSALRASDWLVDRSPGPEMRSWADATIPLGLFEAFVASDAPGRIATVKLTGDFVADSPSVFALEEQLRGMAASWRSVGQTTEAVFTRPPAVIVGLGSLRTITDTILRALGNEPNPPAAP